MILLLLRLRAGWLRCLKHKVLLLLSVRDDVRQQGSSNGMARQRCRRLLTSSSHALLPLLVLRHALLPQLGLLLSPLLPLLLPLPCTIILPV
jgi:hypothetical protein